MILNFASDIQRGSVPTGYVYRGNALIWERVQIDQLAQPPEIEPYEIAIFELDADDNYTGVKLFSELTWVNPSAFEDAHDYILNNPSKRCVLVTGKSTSIATIPNGFFSGISNIIGFFGRNQYGYIGSGAFAGCANLKTVDIYDLYKILQSAFASCSSLKYFRFPEYVLNIGDSAFAGSGLVKVDTYAMGQGNHAVSCGQYAFAGTRLREFYFPPGFRPNSGTSSSQEATMIFAGCMNLSVIYVDQVYAPDIYHSPWQANAPWGATNATVIYREA